MILFDIRSTIERLCVGNPNLTIGVCCSAFVQKENIKDYVENRSKCLKKGKGKQFAAGIEELEALQKQPTVSQAFEKYVRVDYSG